MKTAGVRFDFYDDPNGSLLKKNFPTSEDVPEIVKVAHILNPEERDVLRDEAYALVMHNEGKVLRKFACVDPGNTLLSVLYFGETMDLLPDEAVKVAATNLCAACDEFGFETPLFLKAAARNEAPKASAMARNRDPMQQPLIGDEADWASRTNLLSVQSGRDSGKVNDALTASLNKSASTSLEMAAGQTGKNPCIQNCTPDGVNHDPKAELLMSGNIVDVSGKTPKAKKKEKTASRYALGDKYPIDNFGDVQEAVKYFDLSGMDFTPRERHWYAVKVAERADELGIQMSEELHRYGSRTYAPDADAHIANRLTIVQDPTQREMYQELREKRASINPEVYAELLTEADKVSGLAFDWGGAVADPFYATFGGMTAKEKRAEWTWDKNPSIDAMALKEIGHSERFQQAFDSDIVSAFNADPVTIFESMPAPQQEIIANFSKEASAASELAGLGILAAPSASHLAGHEWGEKPKAIAEVGGLGLLAAPYVKEIGKKMLKK